MIKIYRGESLSGIVLNMLDYDIVVSEFKLQSHYYIYFQIITFLKGMNPLRPQLQVK